MKIGQAERRDFPRILSIQKKAYLAEAALYDDYALPPLRESLEEIEAESASKIFLKAEIDGTVGGSVRLALFGPTCIVGRLAVDPRFQRRGIGSALLLHAESVFPEAARFELFTGSRSEANLRLYERHGYVRFREEVLSPAVTLTYLQKVKRPPV